jgi:hypothetical protein
MAKTKVSQWDSVAANNTDINSININEGCPPSTINNAIRETMAQIKDWQDGSSGDGWTSTGTITSNGTLTSNGLTNINGSVYLDGSLGTNGQVLTSVGSTNTPVWSSLGTMSAQNSNAVAITGGAITTTGTLNVIGSLTMDGTQGNSGQVLTSVGSANTPVWSDLGLGTMSTQNNTSVNIDGGTITGTTVNGHTVGSNSTNNKTVSTGNPSGGSNGDIWYKYI